MTSVLFVCMGNICRSPTAEGVFRELLQAEGLGEAMRVDSAGTHAYHIDEAPDFRAQAVALERGIDLSTLRARQVTTKDFLQFDHLVAMDRENLSRLESLRPADAGAVLHLLMGFAPEGTPEEVPDPYYGGEQDYVYAFELIHAGATGLLAALRADDR